MHKRKVNSRDSESNPAASEDPIACTKKRMNSGSQSNSSIVHSGLSPALRSLTTDILPPELSLDTTPTPAEEEEAEKFCKYSSIRICGGNSSPRRITREEIRESAKFREWKDDVDRKLVSVGSPPSDLLRDAIWRDMYDQGASTSGAIKAACGMIV